MDSKIPQQPESVSNTKNILLAGATMIPLIGLMNTSEAKAENQSFEKSRPAVNQVAGTSIFPEDRTFETAQLALPLDNKLNGIQAANLSNSSTGRKATLSVKSIDGEVSALLMGAQKIEVGENLGLSLVGGLMRKSTGEKILVGQSSLTYKLGDNVSGIVYGQVATGEQTIVGTGVTAKFGSAKLDLLYETKGNSTYIQTDFSVEF